MAKLPTLQETERAILDVFKQFGTRPNESIRTISLTSLLSGSNPFRADDLNAAVQSMADKGWIGSNRAGFYTLTEAGFEQV